MFWTCPSCDSANSRGMDSCSCGYTLVAVQPEPKRRMIVATGDDVTLDGFAWREKLQRAGIITMEQVVAGLQDGSVSHALGVLGSSESLKNMGHYEQLIDYLVAAGYDVHEYRSRYVSGVR